MIKNTRIVVTGRLGSGKSTFAAMQGHAIVPIAQPLKALVDFACPPNATKMQKRPFYQLIGQYGRGRHDFSHKMSTDRMAITMLARTQGHQITGYGTQEDWMGGFGRSEDFWINIAASRVKQLEGAAIDDARFANELDPLVMEHGFQHFHVMAPTQDRMERIGRPYSPELDENISEHMAMALDYHFMGMESAWGYTLPGEKVLDSTIVVWNSDEPCPVAGAVSLGLDFLLAEELGS